MRNRGSNPAIWIFLSGLIFVSLCCPLLTFAQGQQPLVQIDFEQFSAPVNQFGGQASLTVGSATFISGGGFGGGLMRNQEFWSVDESNVFGTWFGVPESPQQPSDGCSGGLEIDFHEKVSNFSAVLLSTSQSLFGAVPATYTICDDQGGSQQITLPVGGGGTVSLPDSGIRRVNIFPTSLGGEYVFWAVDNVRFTPIPPVLLDPVDSGFLNGGSQVCGNLSLPACEAQMASGGVPITAIAADAACAPPPVNTCTGVTQAVVRIPANTVGETLNVTVQDENGNPCSGDDGVANDGGVFLLGDSPGSADCNVDVTAVGTPNNGAMAFVVYLSPVNYARGPQDYSSSSRAISLQIQSDDDPNYVLTANASVVRPPVVLVHGLWGAPGDWDRNGFAIPIAGVVTSKVDYSGPVQGVTATYPTYDQGTLNLNNIPTSALGLSYNAGTGAVNNSRNVDTQIRKSIKDFRQNNNAAAVTADVVAHSMGGDILRTIALKSGFQSNDTYGHGPIDKLITIGTPHLGSPLATNLLQDANKCVRQRLAKKGYPSMITVTTSAGVINGGVGDLEGDGFGTYGALSQALQDFYRVLPPFPMARVSATTDLNNLSSLDCTPLSGLTTCLAWWLRNFCSGSLAASLTSTGWITNFNQDNDAVVPLISQRDNRTSTIATLPGDIHSLGLATLNFTPPTELDPTFGALATVVNLLNEAPGGEDFQ